MGQLTRWASAACQRCGQRFAYVRAPRPRTYCDPCREQKARESKQLAKEHKRQRQAGELPPPDLPPMPDPPDWSRAFCQQSPGHMRHYWTSTIPAEREAASHACRTRCEVQEQCAAWSLCLPLNDSAVYAGMSQNERRRRKRAMLDELARQALKGLRLRLPWPHVRGRARPLVVRRLRPAACRPAICPAPAARQAVRSRPRVHARLAPAARGPCRPSQRAAGLQAAPGARLAAVPQRAAEDDHDSRVFGCTPGSGDRPGGTMPFDYTACPEFSGPVTEPAATTGAALDLQALAQSSVRLPRLDQSALARGDYVPLGSAEAMAALLPDREMLARERAERYYGDLLREQLTTAARTAARDALLAQSVTAQVLADVDREVEAAMQPADTSSAEPVTGPPAEPEVRAAEPAPEPATAAEPAAGPAPDEPAAVRPRRKQEES